MLLQYHMDMILFYGYCDIIISSSYPLLSLLFAFWLEPQLIATLSDLFDAGTETTATTILWALVYMLQHPAIMRTVQEEIDTSVGRDRTLTIADKSTRTSIW